MGSRRRARVDGARHGGMKALQRAGFGALAAVLVTGSVLVTLGSVGVGVAGATITTLYASPTGSSTPADTCILTAAPCSLTRALTVAVTTTTIELFSGTYTGHFSIKAGLTGMTLEPKTGTTGSVYTLTGTTTGTVLTLPLGAGLTVVGLHITKGKAAAGGGIKATTSSLVLTRSTVIGDTATTSGGGIYAFGTTITVRTSTIATNTATGLFGGGIYAYGTTQRLTLSNDTLSGNTASSTSYGGDVYLQGSETAIIEGSTVAGGQLHASTHASMYLAGSIVAKAASCTETGTGTFHDAGYNVADSGGCGFTATTPTATHHSVVDAAIDNYLGSLGANGGPTATIALLGAPSPATTTADPALGNIPKTAAVTVDGSSYTQCSSPDQRGVSRDSATFCDAGAFELTPTPTVTSFSPITGPTTGATTVTIAGTNLTAVTAVDFGTTAGTVTTTHSTSTSLVVKSPAHAAGAVKITVDTSHGDVTSTGTFTYRTVLTATKVSLNSATATHGSETAVKVTPAVTYTTGGTAKPVSSGTVVVDATSTTTGATSTLCTDTLGTAATCSPSASDLAAGKYTLKADYSGTTTFAGSSTATSPAQTLTVMGSSPTATLTLSSTSATYGNERAEVFTGTVTPAAGTPTPTGTAVVEHTVSGTPITVCTITLSGGSGTCSPTSETELGAGTYTVELRYGATGFPSATSSVHSFSVAAETTTTMVTESTGSVVYGAENAEVVSVSVAPEYAAGGPATGTVTVMGGTTTLCSTVALLTGKATCTLTAAALTVSPSAYSLSATFAPSTADQSTSSTAAKSLTVTKAATTTHLTITGSPATYGDESAASLEVTVTPSTSGTPTGTVRIDSGTTTICTTVTLTSGTATCHPAYEALLPGTSSLIATYTGSTDFTASTSSAATLTVNPASSTTSISVNDTSVGYGKEHTVTITPTVTVTSPSTATPSGTVTVSATASTVTYPVCTYTIGSGTDCSPSAIALPAGTYTLSADYSGTTGITGSSTSTHTLTVDQATPTVALTLSSTSATYGNEGTEIFTATVAAPSGSAGVPTGTVTVEYGSTPTTLCTVTLTSGTGHCSLTTAQLGATTYATVKAHYNGDTNYPSATSSVHSFSVAAEATKATVAPSESTVAYGHLTSVVFTVTITPRYAGTPTGSAKVYADLTTGKNVTLCTVTDFVTGSGVCHTTTATALGASPYAYSIEAAYTPSASPADFVGSTSPGAPLTVGKAQSTTTTLEVTPGSVDYGDELATTFTVEVTPEFSGVPEGTVLVSTTVSGKTVTLCTANLAKGTGTTSIGTCKVTGKADPAALGLAPATYEVGAAYTPAESTSDYLASVATTDDSWVVTKAPTTTTVTVAPSRVPDGKETTAVVSATVSPKYAGIPTGTVTVTGPGTAAVCTITLATGKGTCSPSNPILFSPVKSYTLAGAYGGSTDFLASKGTTSLEVTAGAATVTVTSSPNPVLPGHPVTFSATVTGLSNSATPTGTVTFSEGTTTLCTKVSLTTGIATCTATLPDAATQTISASYSGDATHLGSAGTFTQKVASGYWTAAADGSVYAFGTAGFYGSVANIHLNAPVVGMAATPTGKGYWLVGSDGGVFSFGAAHFYGSTGSMVLNKPIVGMEPTPTGKGYWLVASDGGVFSFGAAHFYGSTGSMTLNAPIVGMVPTKTGGGYWLVASDGGVFAFGNAPFVGSAALSASAPVTGLAPTPTGKGYWLTSENGGVFSYGTALFHGSLGGTPQPPGFDVEGIASTSDGGGYWLVGNNGGVFAFGDAAFDGSLPSSDVVSSIVTVAGL